ncbi:MAG TPA: acyl-CoA mutase large subunit family protein [Anaeromyxobacteraceae bacterium]|nr:acyl-CoA mutase large subunit family protein [Anaeromyxobacteraceae bacterium]
MSGPGGAPDEAARRAAEWEREFAADPAASGRVVRNRSGIEVKPLYAPSEPDAAYVERLGWPGQPPGTRGIYATMHRGRTWSQRQLIGLGTPEDHNRRLIRLVEAGANAVSLIPCNSVYRGLDADEVEPELLGTCGVVVNTVDDMDTCLRGIDLARVSTAVNDPSPFTLLALLLVVAERRGVPWDRIAGTSNQSDYLSHFIANHMFFRLALPGARRVLLDHVAFAGERLPRWNPVSVVGQHMQQAGATPAEAMGLTLSTAVQYAQDCRERGMALEAVLPRFTFFFDVSISFFEEVAKFRAGRRIWARIVRERFGVTDPRSWRFKFHGQTSGVDLTRQQPLVNVTRAAVQAMAGIFGGLQSLHVDSWDEVLSVPTERAARIAVATQNVLREEAHLTDVIDPLGGSYYVETLTDQMEAEIEKVIARVDAAGGMYRAAEGGLVQGMIGRSALAFQERIDAGEEKVVGVNAYRVEEEEPEDGLERPDRGAILAQVERLRRHRKERSASATSGALDALARAAHDPARNVFGAVVDAARAGATHGEICAALRRELGFGQPLVVP